MGTVGVVMVAVAAGAPLVAWPLISRRWFTGIAVEVLIAGYLTFVVAVGVGSIYTRARWEVLISYAPVAAALMWLGSMADRRRLGPRRSSDRMVTGTVIAGVHLGILLMCGSGFAVMLNTEPFLPRANEVLPLPAGMVLVSDEDSGCGSGTCTRRLTITSDDERPATELYRDVVNHVRRERGWDLDRSAGCRPAGWLLDHTTLCVQVGIGGPHDVSVALTGEQALVF